MQSCLLLLVVLINAKFYSVTLQNGVYSVKEGKDNNALAHAEYDADMQKKGWNKLFVRTNINSGVTDQQLAYAVGYLEGAIDVESTWQTLVINNYGYANSTVPAAIINWINENWAWTKTMAQKKIENVDYWSQVELIVNQLEGNLKGYNDNAPSNKQITLSDLLVINTAGDRETLNLFLSLDGEDEIISEELYRKHIAESHCSCLIKLAADYSDLYTGHTTWNTFDTMLRTYKIYDFQYNKLVSSKISFSSYPATFSSIDDFYVTEKGLSVIETTNGVMNKTLLNYVKPQSVLSWVRVMVANRMASNGSQWVQIFSLYNSGTYNNQWIVTDYKQLDKQARTINAGALWIAEQIPGYIESADMTSFLKTKGYWPSYNIPYFPYIFNISGFPAYVEKYGQWFAYSGSPRAKIFARDQASVDSIDTFKWIMRYNNWENDPLAEGNAGNGISSRFDLVTQTNVTNPFLAKACFGGIDSKVSSAKEFENALTVHAQSGPTFYEQPAFDWSAWNNILHAGLPNKYIFDFQTYDLKGSFFNK